MAEEESAPRFESEFTLTTVDRGRIRLKFFDRITVDDVFLHLVNREVYRVLTGEDPGDDVDQNIKDFLIKEGFTLGQG